MAGSATITSLLFMAASVAPSDTDGWFSSWAKGVEFESLQAEFVVEKRVGLEIEEKLEGSWYVRLSPSFAQLVRYKRFVGGKEAGERHFSWHAGRGEGRQYTRHRGLLRGSGVLSVRPPKFMGRVELPSNEFFYFRRSRSLSRLLKMVDVETRPLPGGDRFAAFLPLGEAGVVAYLFDRSRQQPLVEMRSYTVKLPPAEIQNTNLGEKIELPEQFADALFFVNKKITASTRIRGRSFPTAWEIRPCLGHKGEVIHVTLKPETIRIDGPAPDHGYVVDFPPGTEVYNSSTTDENSVGDEGELVDAEVVTEAELDLQLEDAGFAAAGAGSATPHSAVVTACGPNALYFALAMRGTPRPLAEISAGLGISTEQSFCSVAKLLDYTASIGVDAMAVEGDESLLHTAKGVPVLLHVRRKNRAGEYDHFLIVDDHDEESGRIRVFDPPTRTYRTSVEAVRDVWSGKAVIFDPEAIATLRSARTFAGLRSTLLFVVTGAFFLSAFFFGTRKR